jgi:hypothetical protein
MAVSPDGRWITFGVRSGDKQQLWIRSLDSLTARPLPGTDGARYSFWSPDSRSVAFFTQIDLLKVDVAGGTAQKIAAADNPMGGSWNQDGTILLSLIDRGLFRVPATGGALVPVATDAGQEHLRARFPFFLPDGHRFLYLGQSERRENDAIYVGSLDAPERSRLFPANRKVEYASGRLLFLSGQTLMAQSFDLRSQRLIGEAVAVAESVATSATGYAAYSVSTNGVLATAVTTRVRSQLTWFDRDGKRLSDLTVAGSQGAMHFDAKGRLLFQREDGNAGFMTLWTFDPEGKRESRIASGGSAVSSPDGESVVFQTAPDERTPGIVRLRLANPGQPERLVTKRGWPTDWSPDGRSILFMHPEAKTQFDISVLTVDGSGTVKPLVQSAANEGQGRFSPDGRWIAYQSDETGRMEVYVCRFPDGAQKSVISNAEGSEAWWNRRSNELLYLAGDGFITAVSIRIDGDRVIAGRPTPLFQIRTATSPTVFGDAYAPVADGNRFLVRERPGDQTDQSLIVVTNWPSALKK